MVRKSSSSGLSSSAVFRPMFRIKIAVFVVLAIMLIGLIFLFWQNYAISQATVSADQFWVNQRYQAGLARLNLGEESIGTEEERAGGATEQARALSFPKANDLPPPSDIASWQGIAPIKEGKVVQIVLSAQRLLAWQDGRLLGNFLASTGKVGMPTLQGNFEVLTKLEMAYGSGDGDSWAMPFWIGFYMAGGSENGIHALPYINGYKEGAGSLGWPVSHGCVRIADINQEWLYNWVEIGTPVIVQWGID
jgi:lipoprotein-anchoring transpeptidase ErfK/SrfK